MKEKNIILTIVITLSLVMVIMLACKDSSPSKGETWRYRLPHPENHPELKPYYDYKVLDVRNGYTIYLDLQDSTVNSELTEVFKCDAKCIYKE